jgi:hypothetical protein
MILLLKRIVILSLSIFIGHAVGSYINNYLIKINKKYYYETIIQIEHPVGKIDFSNKSIREYYAVNIIPFSKDLLSIPEKIISKISDNQVKIGYDILDNKISFNDHRKCKPDIVTNVEIFESKILINYIVSIKNVLHENEENLHNYCLELYLSRQIKVFENDAINIKNYIQNVIGTLDKNLIITKDVKLNILEEIKLNSQKNNDLLRNLLFYDLNQLNFLKLEKNYKIIETKKILVHPDLHFSQYKYLSIIFSLMIGLLVCFYKEVKIYLNNFK